MVGILQVKELVLSKLQEELAARMAHTTHSQGVVDGLQEVGSILQLGGKQVRRLLQTFLEEVIQQNPGPHFHVVYFVDHSRVAMGPSLGTRRRQLPSVNAVLEH